MRLKQLLRDSDDVIGQIASLQAAFNDLQRSGFATGRLPNVDAFRHRTQSAFDLSLCCRNLLESLRAHRDAGPIQSSRRRLRNWMRIAQRLNRESPIPYTRGTAAVPIDAFKNILRDGCERMHFLALHPFPSAYDFFCTTYVDAPRGYRQELHYHKRSRELSLVVDGRADCVWYHQKGTALVEAGRLTAFQGQAFQIPERVIHTIENPQVRNRNLTAKVSMSIDDRVGAKDVEFTRARADDRPVVLDLGHMVATTWGQARYFQHSYGDLKYAYRLDLVAPGAEFRAPSTDWYAFLTRGRVTIPTDRQVEAGQILHLCDESPVLVNFGDCDAWLFSVEGLSFRDFIERPLSFPQFPAWCRAPLGQPKQLPTAPTVAPPADLVLAAAAPYGE